MVNASGFLQSSFLPFPSFPRAEPHLDSFLSSPPSLRNSSFYYPPLGWGSFQARILPPKKVLVPIYFPLKPPTPFRRFPSSPSSILKPFTQIISLFFCSPCMKLMTCEMHFVFWDFDSNLLECHMWWNFSAEESGQENNPSSTRFFSWMLIFIECRGEIIWL